MSITEFLLARVAEDEKAAQEDVEALECWAEDSPDLDAGALLWHARRVLRECEAKRLELEELERMILNGSEAERSSAEWLLRVKAGVYADHSDYDPEWRP